MCSFWLYGPLVVYPVINRLVPAPLDLKLGNVREAEELFLVESGILGLGFWNTAQGIPLTTGIFQKLSFPRWGIFYQSLPWGGEFVTYKFLFSTSLLKHSVACVKNKSTNLFKRFGSSKRRVAAFTEHWIFLLGNPGWLRTAPCGHHRGTRQVWRLWFTLHHQENRLCSKSQRSHRVPWSAVGSLSSKWIPASFCIKNGVYLRGGYG